MAAALNNVAEIHRLQRQYSTAEPLYHQALEILIDTLGTSHPSTAAAMHNLGGFYLLQRDVDQAKQYYEKALACKEAALGRNHPEYATTLFHLAEALKLEGRRQDSLALLKQSLDILGAYSAASYHSLLTHVHCGDSMYLIPFPRGRWALGSAGSRAPCWSCRNAAQPSSGTP